MIAWNYVLGRGNTPHIIKLRVSCYVRPLRHNNCSVPFISNSEWVNVCHWNNHTPVFFKPVVVAICIIYFPYYWIPEWEYCKCLLSSVCIWVFLENSTVWSLDGNVFKTPLYNIPALLVPLFLFPVGMDQNKSLDLSKMIPVAVQVLYFFF